jgi:hypothetical protein
MECVQIDMSVLVKKAKYNHNLPIPIGHSAKIGDQQNSVDQRKSNIVANKKIVN